MTGQHSQLLSGLGIPESYRAVVAAGGDQPAVGTDRAAINVIVVTNQFGLLIAAHIPDRQRIFGAGKCNKEVAVGAEG